VIHPPIYGAGPWEDYSAFDRGWITMINPCAVKGISIFLALADRLPTCDFAALPGWGTTSADREELARRGNITVLPKCPDIRDVLARTRILLMPSLWHEGFGLSVMEAMLHGIPVISSDAGGLREAKLGTGYVIPVPGIERYEPSFDERGMPRPVIPEIPVEPWVGAVEGLVSDAAAYRRECSASQEAARHFVGCLRAGAFEEFLCSLRPKESARRGLAPAGGEQLSPEKRALLLRRLRQRSSAKKS
jgi:glycosyltransferase involved in cell wall biosynthesis